MDTSDTCARLFREEVVAIIDHLNLPRYGRSLYKKTQLRDLKSDTAALHGLLVDTGEILTPADHKLQALFKLLKQDHPSEKFILFTQFADTAKYLAESLKQAGLDHVDCATGDSEDPAKQAWKCSPESNDKLKQFPPGQQNRVLIATDVLSEGQNLQDAARVINYDLPWAINRLIQRTGCVDRTGQKAEEIHCYSFLPDDLTNLVTNLHDAPAKEPRILCSLGLA